MGGLGGRWPARWRRTRRRSASIHPDYLAYFNWASGGPDRGSEHLIDSNLDWGQDLVKLDRWLRANRPGRKVGLAYFGQINPSLSEAPGRGVRVVPAAGLPGAERSTPMGDPARQLVGPAPRLTPGLYAVSASVVRGLPWRFYDSASLRAPELAWLAGLERRGRGLLVFRGLTPVARVGHSIYIYERHGGGLCPIGAATGWELVSIE